MGTGAITTSLDVAQLVLYGFWVFFAGLIFYLVRENHREGYPMENDHGITRGWPIPSPKTYLLPNGHELQVPRSGQTERALNATPVHRWAGSPVEPTGNPLLAGVGPGSWCEREDEPDLDALGKPKILPLRVLPDYGVDAKDFDPRGAEVLGADGEVAGFVSDLWLDTADVLFRYLQVSVKGNGRQVLLPMTFARVKRGQPVRVHALHGHQFADVPGQKSPDTVTVLEEEKIVAYFGAGMLYADAERAEPLI
jgi:photosynthetic reaction center H subunit